MATQRECGETNGANYSSLVAIAAGMMYGGQEPFIMRPLFL